MFRVISEAFKGLRDYQQCFKRVSSRFQEDFHKGVSGVDENFEELQKGFNAFQ